jgi:hypothetical protein
MITQTAEVTTPIDVSFVLKALGYGAMGIAAIVLCLSYLLVRQLAAANPPRPPTDGAWRLVQRYMRFALICTGAMVGLQLADQVLKIYTDKKIEALQLRVLNVSNFDSISEWHWDWAEGGWETKGTFMKVTGGKYRFSATTQFRGSGANETIMRWESTAPTTVSDDDSDIVFLGTREVVASGTHGASLNLGPSAVYPTRFTLKRSWALVGTYSGPNGEGPIGNMMFYAPRNK